MARRNEPLTLLLGADSLPGAHPGACRRGQWFLQEGMAHNSSRASFLTNKDRAWEILHQMTNWLGQEQLTPKPAQTLLHKDRCGVSDSYHFHSERTTISVKSLGLKKMWDLICQRLFLFSSELGLDDTCL